MDIVVCRNYPETCEEFLSKVFWDGDDDLMRNLHYQSVGGNRLDEQVFEKNLWTTDPTKAVKWIDNKAGMAGAICVKTMLMKLTTHNTVTVERVKIETVPTVTVY